jgi:hypothetical protein
MKPEEAIKILGLPETATATEREQAFKTQRAKLEQKLAQAPTPGLQNKYREAVRRLEEAFETLELLNDESDIPALRPDFQTSGTNPNAIKFPNPGQPPIPVKLEPEEENQAFAGPKQKQECLEPTKEMKKESGFDNSPANNGSFMAEPAAADDRFQRRKLYEEIDVLKNQLAETEAKLQELLSKNNDEIGLEQLNELSKQQKATQLRLFALQERMQNGLKAEFEADLLRLGELKERKDREIAHRAWDILCAKWNVVIADESKGHLVWVDGSVAFVEYETLGKKVRSFLTNAAAKTKEAKDDSDGLIIENRCVCCDKPIPPGTHICPLCGWTQPGTRR